MTRLSKMLVGTAGLAAAITIGSAAVAQYPYPYPDPYSYGYPNSGYPNSGNVVGQIIGNVLGYGQFPYGNYGYGQAGYGNAQIAVNQCARAVEQRLNSYNYGGFAYNRGGRVLGIEDVDTRSWGRLRIKGVATSGRNYDNPWGYGNYAYNRSFGVPDLRFTCKADPSGRVYDVDINPYRYRG